MLKLNVGCGSKPLNGYTNIDVQTKAADINAECTDLPFEKSTVDEIVSFHLIEHMDKVHAEKALVHWYNLLKPGGKIVIECPDLEEIIKKYLLTKNEELLYSIYGRNRYKYDVHLWGYTKESISTLLSSIGFSNIKTMGGTDYHSKFEPCMRIEAKKGL